ncbi:hypothetical protein WJX79_001065 [Trebouxia sp. C0005]
MTRTSFGLQQRMLSSICSQQKRIISRHGILCLEQHKAGPDKPSTAHNLPVLPMIATEQAAFKAEDHLTALATLSDQDFYCKFHVEGDMQRDFRV